MESNPRVRTAVDCGEMAREDMSGEIMAGNALGGKPGSDGDSAETHAESCTGGGAIPVGPLSPHTPVPAVD